MPRKCSVCANPKRLEIERAVVAGESLRDVARQWRVSKDALNRHRPHLTGAIVEAKAEVESAQAKSTLDSLRECMRRALDLLEEAAVADPGEGRGRLDNVRVQAMVLAEVRQQHALQARLLGELKDGTTINVLVASPEWVALRAKLVAALLPHPEAAAAVAKVLEA